MALAAGGGVPEFLRSPTWAAAPLRGAPLRSLLERADCPTQKRFADELGWHQDTVTRWLAHGDTPTTAAFRDLGTYFGRKVVEPEHRRLNEI